MVKKFLIEIINYIQTAAGITLNNDSIMIRSLNFKRNCELDIQTYEDLYSGTLIIRICRRNFPVSNYTIFRIYKI